ncbi:MAG: helix-turn-helix domain-containing protein [Parvibaculaceae bacterium]
MNKQIITSPTGERLVVLPEAEYLALVEATEDAHDRALVRNFRHKLAEGEEELVPSDVAERLLADENPVRVWREHRGLSTKVLAGKADIAQPYLSQIETGKREGTIRTMKRIAEALGVQLDDLV